MTSGNSQDFDLERVMDEWRRFYDWAVLSRKSTVFIEEVSFLGQQYSSILSLYKQTTGARQRSRLYTELETAFAAMQALYDRLDVTQRISLRLRNRVC